MMTRLARKRGSPRVPRRSPQHALGHANGLNGAHGQPPFKLTPGLEKVTSTLD
jgi:hypothetical protein